MTRTPIKSSMIRAAAHDGAATMEIEFANGVVYRYAGVPPEVYGGLLAAPSAGQYFGKHVRGKYASERQQPELHEAAGA